MIECHPNQEKEIVMGHEIHSIAALLIKMAGTRRKKTSIRPPHQASLLADAA